jgi:hypothetical protein
MITSRSIRVYRGIDTELDLKIRYQCMDLIYAFHDRDQWRVFVNRNQFLIPQKDENILTRKRNIIFTRSL